MMTKGKGSQTLARVAYFHCFYLCVKNLEEIYTPAKGGHWRGNDPSDPTTQGAGSYRCAPTLRSVQMDSTVLARYRVRFSSNIHLILALFQLETFLLCRQRLRQNCKILLSKGNLISVGNISAV